MLSKTKENEERYNWVKETTETAGKVAGKGEKIDGKLSRKPNGGRKIKDWRK